MFLLCAFLPGEYINIYKTRKDKFKMTKTKKPCFPSLCVIKSHRWFQRAQMVPTLLHTNNIHMQSWPHATNVGPNSLLQVICLFFPNWNKRNIAWDIWFSCFSFKYLASLDSIERYIWVKWGATVSVNLWGESIFSQVSVFAFTQESTITHSYQTLEW